MDELRNYYQPYVVKSPAELYNRLKKGNNIVVTPKNDDTKKYDLYAHPPIHNSVDTGYYGVGSTTIYRFNVKEIGSGVNGYFMNRIPIGESLEAAPLSDIKREYNFWESRYGGGKNRTRRNLQKKSRKHIKSYKNRKSRKC